MYLLLPLEDSANQRDNSWKINWSAIDSCVSAVEFMKKRYSEAESKAEMDSEKQSASAESDSKVHFANETSDINQLKDRVVLAIHTGRIYSVLKVPDNLTSDSPFEQISDSTYADYFKKK